MADWNTLNARVNVASMRVFGEHVTLPGAVEVMGVFDPRGEPPIPPGSDVGLIARISQQISPVVSLLAADAAELRERDPVTIGGQVYLVTRIEDAGNGLVRIWLMPDITDVNSPPEGERWR